MKKTDGQNRESKSGAVYIERLAWSVSVAAVLILFGGISGLALAGRTPGKSDAVRLALVRQRLWLYSRISACGKKSERSGKGNRIKRMPCTEKERKLLPRYIRLAADIDHRLDEMIGVDKKQ